MSGATPAWAVVGSSGENRVRFGGPDAGGGAHVGDDIGDAVGEAVCRVVVGQRLVGGDLGQNRGDVGAGVGGALELRGQREPVRVGSDACIDGVANGGPPLGPVLAGGVGWSFSASSVTNSALWARASASASVWAKGRP